MYSEVGCTFGIVCVCARLGVGKVGREWGFVEWSGEGLEGEEKKGKRR